MNLSSALDIVRNMGPRYAAFRAKHMVETRLGILRRRHPAAPNYLTNSLPLESFRENPPLFFFRSKDDLPPKREDAQLRTEAQHILEGKLRYFSFEQYELGANPDWLLHPVSGKRFPLQHWSLIADLDPDQGDIKYIWDPSRFSHLYTLIRDDHHHGADHGAFVLGQMEHWIDANPVNLGPNWKCSQEISLRLLNWTFALHYYREHEALTEPLWEKIQHCLYWSLHHVRQHIHFSRIAVRNNHAITECLALWLGGFLYPWFDNVQTWAKEAKKWLEEDIAYQIYEDGTYLQHSHNYQRVVVQLLTWALRMSELHQDPLSALSLERINSLLHYLREMSQPGGALPNYGSNDGALFFPLASQDYRDYRPQLDALARALGKASISSEALEEGDWYGLGFGESLPPLWSDPEPRNWSFPKGGIYAFRQNKLFVMLKCQSYRDRPAQADNLHVDLWIDDQNILRDQGTFRYNASPELMRYFYGAPSHNSLQIEGKDEMEKGNRFIFYHWTRSAQANWANNFVVSGKICSFAQLGKRICVNRELRIDVPNSKVEVIDQTEDDSSLMMTQNWHPHPDWLERIKIESWGEAGQSLEVRSQPGFFSKHYGQLEQVTDWTISHRGKLIHTTLQFG